MKTSTSSFPASLPGGFFPFPAFQTCLSALVETVKSYGKIIPKELQGTFDFVYKYDIASIFNYFGMLDATNLAKRIGINPSLLRQYKSGITKASDKQKQKIEHGLHQLGRELLSIRL